MSISTDKKRLFVTSSQGIGWHEVAECLGTTIQDEGVLAGDLEADLSTPAHRINPWAKYKPIRDASNYTGVIRDGVSFGFYLMGLGSNVSGQTGTPPRATSATGLAALYNDKVSGEFVMIGSARANSWRYNPPRGNTVTPKEPYRVRDFLKTQTVSGKLVPVTGEGNGYDHDARQPFGTFQFSANNLYRGSAMGAHQNIRTYSGTVPSTWITVTDINAAVAYAGTIQMNYYGIVFVPLQSQGGSIDTTKPAHFFFNTARIDAAGEGRGKETFNVSDSIKSGFTSQKYYRVYPFLVPNVLENSDGGYYPYISAAVGSPISGISGFYSLPGAEPVEVYIASSRIEIYVSTGRVQEVGSNYNSNVVYAVKNNGTSSTTISSFVLKLRLEGKNYSDARVSGEVFYYKDGNAYYREDDNGTTVVSEITQLLQGRTIAAGATVEVPGGGLYVGVGYSNSNLKRLFIGCYDGGTTFSGDAELSTTSGGITPADPTAET